MYLKMVKHNYSLPILAYSVLYIGLFIEDIAFSYLESKIIGVFVKAIAVILLVLSLQNAKLKKRDLKRLSLCIIFSIIVFLATNDFYWIILILLSMGLSGVSPNKILSVSVVNIVFMTFITIIMCPLGLTLDVLSVRADYSEVFRHSFGFGHSAGLPLCLVYLISYYLCLNNEKARSSRIYTLFLISCLIYVWCGSRNGLLAVALLTVIYRWFKHRIHNNRLNTFNKNILIVSMLTVFAFSFVPMFFRSKELFIDLWYLYDEIFTNRSLLAASALNSYGIHILNCINVLEYRNTIVEVENYIWEGIVLDNGYIYILIRYGILAFIFAFIIIYKVGCKFQSTLGVLVIAVLVLVNMTDNDLLSYGFLPYMVMGTINLWKSRYNIKINNMGAIK